MITRDVTVARLLDEHPGLLEVLASYHPHFGRLRNTLLRRVMAPRVSVAQAAQMAGVDCEELLTVLRQAAGESDPRPGPQRDAPTLAPATEARPAPIAGVPESRVVRVDVREDIRQGREPFAQIMAAVKSLGADRVLVLRAPFEPMPLYQVLGKRGLSHWAERHAADDWSVWFYRATDAAEIAGSGGESGQERRPAAGSEPERIDVRGLEPPQPMVRVLEALDRLPPGTRLEVLHERRPMFLYPQLDERGFAHETDEPEPGLVRIVIQRRASQG